MPHKVLIEALTLKGLVLTTEDMARLAKCDKETIRRRVKDGTLKRIKGIRHIRVSWDNFQAWLSGNQE